MNKFIVDNGKSFDFGKTSAMYAKYRDIYPKELFDKLYKLGIGVVGTSWLDLGTGTGVIPRAMCKYGANITATDISENQIAAAKELSKNISNITYKVCAAENTGFADNSFDAITAVQCFWYFDPEAVVPEIKRMLKKGGVFAKVYMGWLEDHEIASKSTNFVKQLNPDWTSEKESMRDLVTHRFDNPITDSFVVNIPFTRESWHGRMLSCRGVMGSMNEEKIAQFDKTHKEFMNSLPEKFLIAHKVYIVAYKM